MIDVVWLAFLGTRVVYVLFSPFSMLRELKNDRIILQTDLLTISQFFW